MLDFKNYLYILDNSPLSHVTSGEIFSQPYFDHVLLIQFYLNVLGTSQG